MTTKDPHGLDAPDGDIEAAESPSDFGAEPSIDALLKTFGQDSGMAGWEGLDHAGAVMRKVTDEQGKAMREQAALFRAVFNSPEGRQVLEIFLDQTLRRSAWPWAHLQNQEALLAYGIAREAENGFVAAILQALAHGKNDSEVKGRNDAI